MTSVSDTASIEGFTFTGGAVEFGEGGGGGLSLDESYPSLRRNTITGNKAHSGGGGLYLWRSSPCMTNNSITDNSTPYFGGGLYAYESSPTLTGNTIMGNNARHVGGGLHLWNSSPSLTSNTITGNSAEYGGGLCIHESSPTLMQNEISGNSATENGGGLDLFHYSSPTLEGNRISSNTAGNIGGGLCLNQWSSPMLTGNTIAGNRAWAAGGLHLAWRSSPTLISNTIAGNQADAHGGGLDLWSGSCPTLTANAITGHAATWGAGLYVHESSPELMGNTITGNSASHSGGGVAISYYSSPVLANNTIERNSAPYAGGVEIGNQSSATLTGNTVGSNTGHGIACWQCSAVIEGNSVCGNSRSGVAVLGDSHVTITQCPIYGNGGLGIDLGDDGVTPNDPDDLDSGPNDLLNFPEFTRVEVAAENVTVDGVAPPNARVEVFTAAPDPMGYGEGKTYLKSVTAGPDGRFSFDVLVSDLPLTATATDEQGNTSEFCANRNQWPVAIALVNGQESAVVEQASSAGTMVTLDGSQSHDPDGDPITYEWDFTTDGTVDSTDPVVVVTYNLGGPYTATLTVTDPYGASDTDTVDITIVDTIAPSIAAPADVTAEQTQPAGTPREEIDLGTPIVSDICDADLEVANDAPELFPTGATTVTWTATDESGNSAADTQTVTIVDTILPQITIASPPEGASYPYGGAIQFTFSATDSGSGLADLTGALHVEEAVWSVASGDTRDDVPVGGHKLTVTATDVAGNLASASVSFSVANTPGFVTAGGWIELATKKATFGFEVGYAAGDLAPTGNLEYIAHDLTMNVKSTRILGLGVVGNRAAYYGECSVDGEPGHTFRGVVLDNGQSGSTDELHVYLDTGYSAGGALGGGNITIH